VLGDPDLCLAIDVIFLNVRGWQRSQIKVSEFTRTALVPKSRCSRTCGTSPPALLQMSLISWLAIISQGFCPTASWDAKLLLEFSHDQPQKIHCSERCCETEANKCPIRYQV